MDKWKSGEQNLPDLEAWLVDHPFSLRAMVDGKRCGKTEMAGEK